MANRTKIANHGTRSVTRISDDYKRMYLIMHVADVKKTLASAYQIVQAGNKIVLDNDYSYIVSKVTGEKTVIEVNNGEFQFDLWVPAPDLNKAIIKVKDGQMTALITEDSEDSENSVGFLRQDSR